MAYIGKQPGTGVRNRFLYTATAGQTTFTTSDSNLALSYSDALYMDVYLNGVLLDPANDYTATSGTSVVLGSGATAGDVLEIVVYDVFSVFNNTIDGNFDVAGNTTLDNNLTVGGDLTVDTNTLKVDSTNNRVGIGTTSPNTLTTLSANSGNTILELNRANANTTGATGAISFTASDTHSVAAIDVIGDGDNEGGILRFLTTSAASDNYYINSTTERLRIQSGGGISFNGDTAAANALDDYEEGTWTPTFEGGTTNPTCTYDIQIGRYTKIGDYVSVWLRLRTDAYSGGSGTLRVEGLPFTSNGNTNFFGSCALGFTGTWGNSPSSGIINPSNTIISLRKRSSTSVYSSFSTTLDASSSGGDMGTSANNNDIILTGFYKV